MAIWLVRAGSHGEYEQKFFQEKRVYLTWERLNVNLAKIKERADLTAAMVERSPEAKSKAIHNWVGQVWPFVHAIKKGDLVVIPLKSQPAIRIGEVVGDYHYQPSGPDPFFHWRDVKWIAEAVPRTHFGKDLLYTFGAFMTICRIQRNNAEARIAAMRAKGWKPEAAIATVKTPADGMSDDQAENTDLDELAHDQIAQLIGARFKGHGLARLVDAILKAQGYTTYVSPEGTDGGVDILAGAGPLGFGAPRLCVEVKSGDSPADRPAVDKLLGAVTRASSACACGLRRNCWKRCSPSMTASTMTSKLSCH
jgi:restriction system protein